MASEVGNRVAGGRCHSTCHSPAHLWGDTLRCVTVVRQWFVRDSCIKTVSCEAGQTLRSRTHPRRRGVSLQAAGMWRLPVGAYRVRGRSGTEAARALERHSWRGAELRPLQRV